MAFDSLFLTASLTEAKKQCLNSRILKIQEPDRNTILFRLNTLSNEQVTLFLSAHPQQARFQITKNHFTNPQQPPVFCQILRKYLENGKIIRMEQLPWERIAEITIDSRNEIGDPMRLYLVIEIMGKHSNILLLKKENKQRIILDGIHRYSHLFSHWDDNRKAQVKYIAGQFDNYMNASLFKKAYNDHYKTNAVIVEDFALING